LFEPVLGASTSVDTGLRGVLCIGCGVLNPANLVNTLDTAAVMSTPIAVAASVWASVEDTATTYTGDHRVGFLVSLPVGVLDLSLLSSLEITTYLDGVAQESSASGGVLKIGRASCRDRVARCARARCRK